MSAKTTNPTQTHEAVHKQPAVKPAAKEQVAAPKSANLETSQRAVADLHLTRPADVLALQRLVGNQAAQRLIQAKITVGPAGDQYEQEADRVAGQVMTMPAPAQTQPTVQRAAEEEVQTKPLAASITPLVQRAGPEEEEVQTKPLVQREAAPEEEELQAKPLVQREAAPEEEELQATPLVQREAAPEEEELQAKPLVQREAAPEEEELQAKPLVQREAAPEEEELQAKPLVQREAAPEEEELQAKPLVQREAAPEEEELQAKPLVQRETAPEEEELQAKPLIQRSGGGIQASADVEERLNASRGSGSPLPTEVRSFMEPRFGADFSGVRVHTGGEAAQLNRDVSAQAFTHGQDIYLGEGKYAPGSDTGKQLLAHELTHVVQQNGAQVQHSAEPSPIQRQEGDQERIKAFLIKHADHAHLLQGFDDGMNETQIVGHLLENFFRRTDFNYNFSSSEAFTHKGDCSVLVKEFIAIAKECFGIEMISHKEERKYFIPIAQKIVHKEEKKGNIDGKRWYFENHVWAIWHGKPIDVLFGQLGLVSHLAGVKERRDLGEYAYSAGDFVFYVKKGATSEFDRYTSDPNQMFKWH
jgi:hypothetical protein